MNTDQTSDVTPFDCSHSLRLSAVDWIIVGVAMLAILGLAPILWQRCERFEPGDDYRMPYELSSSYWLYSRYSRQACDKRKTLVIGDSVVWGHYVPANQTLSHYLNEFTGRWQFANLGLDGTHPAALEGLLRFYSPKLRGHAVLLHFNPLWMTSPKHDLQTDKEFHFNHPDLVSQFTVPIPCYKALFAKRARIAIKRTIPFANWIAHLRATYYDSTDIQTWTLRHPYACPLKPLTRGLPDSVGVPEPAGETWVQKGAKKQDVTWVRFDTSLQWKFFRRALDLLQNQGNRVFVLVGPFNEHMLNEADAADYEAIKTQAADWLVKNNIPFSLLRPLPPEHYVDASHPLGEGYALWARRLLEDPVFVRWIR